VKIDVRGLKHPEPLKKIKEAVSSLCTNYVDVEVLVDTCEYGKMVKGFAEMTGCETEVKEEKDYCVVKIKGGSCKCA